MTTDKTAKQETQRLLIMSGVVDLGLGIIKITVGTFANSYALVVDGVHSLSDLITDIMVWGFNAVGSQGPDEDHPYGHARFETFGTFFLGVLLMLVGAYIVYESTERMLSVDSYEVPGWPALLAAALSILVKEWLFRITLETGKRQGSRLLQANAWHHRTDSLSSVIVLVGIGGALVGINWIELLAAIGVAVMVAIIGWDLIKTSVSELVDTALSESYVDAIKISTEDVEGVTKAHSIRTRRMGSDAIVEVHLQVNPAISVSEGHHIGEWVSRKLAHQFQEVNDVIIHIDAEDDAVEEARESEDLPPLRKAIRTNLYEIWRNQISREDILKMDLHYLNNQVDVELYLKKGSPAVSSEELKQTANEFAWLGGILIWREH
ncbi:MAG: cation diffusion facilitator family transporter [Patiriisocius sp.]